MTKPVTIDEFYKEAAEYSDQNIDSLLPEGINKEIGHFNVFNIEEIPAHIKKEKSHMYMRYIRRAYYKISLVMGPNIVEYADKVIHIEKNALLFATPKIPYNYASQTPNPTGKVGHFCIFTGDFLTKSKSGVLLDELPLFRPGGSPVFPLSDEQLA